VIHGRSAVGHNNTALLRQSASLQLCGCTGLNAHRRNRLEKPCGGGGGGGGLEIPYTDNHSTGVTITQLLQLIVIGFHNKTTHTSTVKLQQTDKKKTDLTNQFFND
jgi:hypothetical protein